LEEVGRVSKKKKLTCPFPKKNINKADFEKRSLMSHGKGQRVILNLMEPCRRRRDSITDLVEEEKGGGLM